MQQANLNSRNRVFLTFFSFLRVTTPGTAVLLGTLTLAELTAGAQSAPAPMTIARIMPVSSATSITTSTSYPNSDTTSSVDRNQDPPAQTPPNPTPPKPKIRIDVGPNIGVYIPTSSKTRSQFGSTWWDYGVGFGLNRVRTAGGFRPDLHILSQAADGNRFFIGLVGVEYRKALLFGMRRPQTPSGKNGDGNAQPQGGSGKPGDGNGAPPENPVPAKPKLPYLLPYFGFSADLAVGDLRDVGDDVHSGVRTGFSGTAFLGVNIGRGFYFETRYREVTQFKGFDLSGLNFTAGYRFRLK